MFTLSCCHRFIFSVSLSLTVTLRSARSLCLPRVITASSTAQLLYVSAMGAQKKRAGHQKQPPVQNKPTGAKMMLCKKVCAEIVKLDRAQKQAEKKQQQEAKKRQQERRWQAEFTRKKLAKERSTEPPPAPSWTPFSFYRVDPDPCIGLRRCWSVRQQRRQMSPGQSPPELPAPDDVTHNSPEERGFLLALCNLVMNPPLNQAFKRAVSEEIARREASK